jgi:hypothetical protein
MDDDDDTQVYKDHGDALTIAYQSGYYDGKKAAQEPVARILQIIKELRPAIKPMEGMGKGKTTDEWFDILVKEIEQVFKEMNT